MNDFIYLLIYLPRNICITVACFLSWSPKTFEELLANPVKPRKWLFKCFSASDSLRTMCASMFVAKSYMLPSTP